MFQMSRLSSVKNPYRYLGQYEGFCDAAWPTYMNNDTFVHLCTELIEKYLDYQFVMIDEQSDTLVAIMMTAPLEWHGSYDTLPEGGWEWAIKKSLAEYANGHAKNAGCFLELSINPDYQGRSISRNILKFALNEAKEVGFLHAFGPARPLSKVNYPETDINEYIKWKNKRSQPFDAWLRFHTLLGGRVQKSCSESMVVEGSISQWEAWTGLEFNHSGDYLIPRGLNKLVIDYENDKGVYVESNAWIVYDINMHS